MHLTYEDKASIKLVANKRDGALNTSVKSFLTRVPIMGLEDLKDRVRTCWARLDQQLINNLITTKPLISGDRD